MAISGHGALAALETRPCPARGIRLLPRGWRNAEAVDHSIHRENRLIGQGVDTPAAAILCPSETARERGFGGQLASDARETHRPWVAVGTGKTRQGRFSCPVA